jgi:DNA-binding HxlR family transcriptional regulator
MTKNAKVGLQKCPVDQFQQMISGKYKLRILWDIQAGPRRYGEIKKGLLRGRKGSGEIAARVLSRELKTLAKLELIVRKDYHAVPPKVEYSLTKLGKTLIPVIATMHDWAIRHSLSVPCDLNSSK